MNKLQKDEMDKILYRKLKIAEDYCRWRIHALKHEKLPYVKNYNPFSGPVRLVLASDDDVNIIITRAT